MVSYISRRRRWWNHLKAMDPSIDLSTSVRGDLMLEAAGISRQEQLMVLTSTGNERDFDKLAAALLEQHSHVHVEEENRGGSSPSGKSFGKGGKKWHRRANFGQEEDTEQHDSEVDLSLIHI